MTLYSADFFAGYELLEACPEGIQNGQKKKEEKEDKKENKGGEGEEGGEG